MADFGDNLQQARIAWEVYGRGSRDWLWDPVRKQWVATRPEAGAAPAGPGLSDRALQRIAGVQDAERRGLLSHDAAEREILDIIREET